MHACTHTHTHTSYFPLQVLLSPDQPFKLGPRSLQLLLYQFFYSNFSLTQFTRGLQVWA